MLPWTLGPKVRASACWSTTPMPRVSRPTTASRPFGRLDAALDETALRGSTVVDMRRDWRVVFPFQAPDLPRTSN